MADEFDSFVDDVLQQPEPKPHTPAETTAAPNSVRLIGTNELRMPGHTIIETLTLLTTTRIVSLGPLSDLKHWLSGAVGGRSQSAESMVQKTVNEMLVWLRSNAAAKQAGAVVGVQVRIHPFEAAGGAGFCVTVSGTPVRLSSSS